MRLTERLPRESGRDYALRTLKDNIIHLDLKPGLMVSENELAAEMGLSRTPVREALMELSKVKIVEIFPQKGSTVALIDRSLVEEAQFLRNVLECSVVELVCEAITPAGLRRLQENVNLQRFYLEHYYPDSLMELDNQFHRTLFEIAQKPQIYTLMSNIAIHFDRVRSLALSTVKNPKIIEDHQAIVDAVERKDVQAARTTMQQHLNRYKIDAKAIQQAHPSFFKT